MVKTNLSVADYIESLPSPVREDIAKLDKELTKLAKGEKVMWEGKFWGGSDQKIIGYGNLTYASGKKISEWFNVGLAMQKNYISMYIVAVVGNQYIAEKYKHELGKVKVGKSVVSFNSLKDVNLPKLLEMSKFALAQKTLR